MKKELKITMGGFSKGTEFEIRGKVWYRVIEDALMRMDDAECMVLETWDYMDLFETTDSQN